MSQITVDIAERTEKSMTAPVEATSALSILVLDDDTEVRETICAMLGSFGMNVSCADSADAFFKQLDRARFDVVILDLLLPDCDGLEVLGRLAPLQECQVVIASGSGKRVLQTAKLSAEAAGVDVLGILPKPLRRKDLKDVLGNAKKCKKARSTQRKAAPRPKIDVPMLRNAIEQRHITCHLQPKIRLSDGVPYGFEALARWSDPQHGMIFPDEFIPVASANGLDFALSVSMLDQAMECLASLSDTSLSVAVNVPVRVCADMRFEPRLDALVEAHGLMPRHVILEVTEAGPSGISNMELDALLRLRLKGYRLSIDDFGTGASSLERLVRIPFDELKIDRLFVRDIDKSHHARSLIRTLVQMGRLFGMTVTIEGVETQEAIKISKKLGCDNAQGYGVAKPMPPAALRQWMAERTRCLVGEGTALPMH
jgi:EAL domain-containing protein (putative c-di-GMP-specific phosphodiesterase class I)/AmiR/NasT family two-component response regulator